MLERAHGIDGVNEVVLGAAAAGELNAHAACVALSSLRKIAKKGKAGRGRSRASSPSSSGRSGRAHAAREALSRALWSGAGALSAVEVCKTLHGMAVLRWAGPPASRLRARLLARLLRDDVLASCPAHSAGIALWSLATLDAPLRREDAAALVRQYLDADAALPPVASVAPAARSMRMASLSMTMWALSTHGLARPSGSALDPEEARLCRAILALFLAGLDGGSHPHEPSGGRRGREPREGREGRDGGGRGGRGGGRGGADVFHVATVVASLARLRLPLGPRGVRAVLRDLHRRPKQELTLRQVSGVMWGLVRMDLTAEMCRACDPEAFDGLMATVVEAMTGEGQADRGRPSHHSSNNAGAIPLMLWGLARLGHEVPAHALASAVEIVASFPDVLDARNLCMLLLVLGKAKHCPPPDVMRVVMGRVEKAAPTFNAKGLSDVLWSTSELRYNPGPEVLDLVMDALASRLPADLAKARASGWSDQSAPLFLPSILRSLSMLRHTPTPEALGVLLDEVYNDVDALNDLCLFQILRSIALLDSQALEGGQPALDWRPHQKMLQALHVRVSKSDYAKPDQGLQNVLWSYAKLGFDPGPKFLTHAMAAVAECAGAMSMPHLNSATWGAASLGYHLPPLTRSPLRAQDDAEIPHAHLAEGDAEGRAVAAIMDEVLSRVQEGVLDAESRLLLPHLLWSFSCMCHRRGPPPQLEAMFAITTAPEHMRSFSSRNLSTLFRTSLVLGCALPSAWQEQAYEAYRRDQLQNTSPFQDEVAGTMARLGIAHETEVRVGDALTVDIALGVGGRGGWGGGEGEGESLPQRVVVEVDGPSHFAFNTNRPNGSTLLRNFLIERMGCEVLTVPHYDWLGLDPTQQEAYLRALIDDRCVIKP